MTPAKVSSIEMWKGLIINEYYIKLSSENYTLQVVIDAYLYKHIIPEIADVLK